MLDSNSKMKITREISLLLIMVILNYSNGYLYFIVNVSVQKPYSN